MRNLVLVTDSVMILTLVFALKNHWVGCLVAAIILASISLGVNIAEIADRRER